MSAIAEWTEDGTAFVSVVFSWDIPAAYQKCVWYREWGYDVRAGGPAVTLNPDYLAGVAKLGGHVNALPHHNPNATFTSRGCIRHCPFCAVPRIEGELLELAEWEVKPIVCDNNLLACSRAHFDRVIDRLKPLTGIDFNQGLDARLLTDHHADRLAELDCMVRVAWDWTAMEPQFMTAFERLRRAGFSKSAIRVYVLIGFDDTPEDALYRLRTVKALGLKPSPMRYQALDSMMRNDHIGASWTHRELTRYMRYWSNLRYLENVPFEEFER
jgi:hypothetical protein